MAPHSSRWPLTLALCSGYFLVLLDVTVVNVAHPQIGTDLHSDAGGLAWVVAAYSIPLASLLLAAGAIGDLIGHRSIVLLGMVCFGVASALCGLAPCIGALIAARALQGAGAALMLPGTLALLVTTSRDEADRSRLVGAWAAVGGAALPAGPVLGGLVVQGAVWRAVFWLSVPVIAAALLPVTRMHGGPRERIANVAKVDLVGAGLLVAALTCLVTAVIQAPTSPAVSIALLLASACAVFAFIRVEKRTEHPLLAVARSARGPLGRASLVAGLMNLCALGGLFLLTQVFQDVHRLEPLEAGLLMLPAMAPLPLLGAPAARLVTRMGTWRTSAIGAGIAAAGMAGIAGTLSNTGIGFVALAGFLMLWGAGLGILTPAIVTAAVSAAPQAPGVASGASNTSRQAGGALGIAIVAAFAGTATSPGFTTRSAGLFLAASAMLALASALSARSGRAVA